MMCRFSSSGFVAVVITLALLGSVVSAANLSSSRIALAIATEGTNQSQPTPMIHLFNTTNFEPVAGGYRINFSGSVFGASGSDMVFIDFGDGTNGTGNINGTNWGPTSHTYDMPAKLKFSTKVVATLTRTEPNCLGCIVATSDPLDLQLTPAMRHHTRIVDVSIPHDVVSGTSITLTGKLIDTNTDTEIPDKTIEFTGEGARPSWRTTTGGFTFSDLNGMEIERCQGCDPDPDSANIVGNIFLALDINSESEIIPPPGTHGVKLYLLNLEGSHFDIEVTKSDDQVTLISESEQLLSNTRTDLNILYPEGIKKVSFISNSDTVDGSKIGILRLQVFDPAGDPEDQTVVNFEDRMLSDSVSNPLRIDEGSFRFTGNARDLNDAADPRIPVFHVNLKFRGDSDYLPSPTTPVTDVQYQTVPGTFGTSGEPATVTDYIGTVWTSLPNVCGTGADADQDGICDSWEVSNNIGKRSLLTGTLPVRRIQTELLWIHFAQALL